MVQLKERISAVWGKFQLEVRRRSKNQKVKYRMLSSRRNPTERPPISLHTKSIVVVTATTVEYEEAPRSPKAPRECIVCRDEYPADELIYFCPPSPSDEASDSRASDASHGYCGGCLVESIRVATNGRHPFRCCGKIFDTNEYPCASLSAEEKQAYEDMVEELTTPQPLYCHDHRCSSFIKPGLIKSDVGTCPKCSAETCKHCRLPSHPEVFCTKDENIAKLLAMAKKKGWKRCPVCGSMVELTKGCFIIKCKCAWSFCYRCGASNQTRYDDNSHRWHPTCWRESDYPTANNRPRTPREQPKQGSPAKKEPEQRPLMPKHFELHRCETGTRAKFRHWWECEKQEHRERTRKFLKLVTILNAEIRGNRSPTADNNKNQARVVPQQNAQPRPQHRPQGQARTPVGNREPWLSLE